MMRKIELPQGQLAEFVRFRMSRDNAAAKIGAATYDLDQLKTQCYKQIEQALLKEKDFGNELMRNLGIDSSLNAYVDIETGHLVVTE